jgi:transcription antitermination factor NusA-like protein
MVKTSDGSTTATVEISRVDRSRAIGQNGSRIKIVRALAKRHCDIDDINLRTV